MFKDDYKNAMDNISAQNEVKSNIRSLLEGEAPVKKSKNKALPWRIGFAVCAAAAVALTAIFIPKDKSIAPIETGDIDRSYLSNVKSYDDVYKAFKKLKDKQDESYELYAVEEEAAIDFDGAAMAGGGTAKGEAKPNTTSPYATKKFTTTTNGAVSDDSVSDTAREDYSDTNTQVEGVDEADIIKTDGKYIYYLYDNYLQIVKAEGGNSRLISTLTLPDRSTDGYYGSSYTEMYLSGERLVLISNEITEAKASGLTGFFYDRRASSGNITAITVYDVSNPASPKLIDTCKQSGMYQTSRMVGDYVYLLTNHNVNLNNMNSRKPETFVPYTICKDTTTAATPESIMQYECADVESSVYLVACVFDVKDATLSSECSLLGGANITYCNTEYLVTARSGWNIIRPDTDDGAATPEYTDSTYTVVSAFTLGDGEIKYKASSEIAGNLEDQFAIDEYNGNFRFVSTVESYTVTERVGKDGASGAISMVQDYRCAQLTILDNDLKPLGKIENLAEGERVYSARFMGDTAYFVTFRQTDPLFSADLSDPKNPKIIGELKIPGFSEYLFPYGEGKLLGLGQDADAANGRTTGLKLSMFDISNPAYVTESDKLIIGGNSHSEALYNHKAALVNTDKNLIGFAYINYDKTQPGLNYAVYSHTYSGFKLKAQLQIVPRKTDKWQAANFVRGLYIGDYFYLAAPDEIVIYNLSDFSRVSAVDF